MRDLVAPCAWQNRLAFNLKAQFSACRAAFAGSASFRPMPGASASHYLTTADVLDLRSGCWMRLAFALMNFPAHVMRRTNHVFEAADRSFIMIPRLVAMCLFRLACIG